jgi:hypothetical protein
MSKESKNFRKNEIICAIANMWAKKCKYYYQPKKIRLGSTRATSKTTHGNAGMTFVYDCHQVG